MSFECYNEYPTYENSTDVKLIKFTDEYGKQNFVYKSQCDMIMSIFPKAQSNTVTSDSIDYLIKYKTVIKEEDIKEYHPSGFTATTDRKVLNVKFKELFDNSDEVALSEYYINIYSKSSVKDINTINIINSHISPLKSYQEKGTNKGNYFNLNYTLPPEAKDFIYVVLTTSFTMKDKEENKFCYGYQEIEMSNQSNLTIILIVSAVGIVFLLIVVFVIVRIVSKKNKNDIIEKTQREIEGDVNLPLTIN